MTPYEVVYGQRFPSIVYYLSGTSKVHIVDSLLHNHEATISTLKDKLAITQTCMKQ